MLAVFIDNYTVRGDVLAVFIDNYTVRSDVLAVFIDNYTVRGDVLAVFIVNYTELMDLWDESLQPTSVTEMKTRLLGVKAVMSTIFVHLFPW